MRSIDDINPIDELIARVGRIPDGGDRERVDLAAARRELDRVFDEAALGRRARGPRSRRWRRSRASVPLIVSCLVVALIAVLALMVLRPSPVARRGSASRPATTSAADALIAKLAVLRRPQTSADRLPRNLKLNREPNGVGLPQGTHWGVILPSLSRLVATPPGARLYLVVTTPVSGSQALWRASLGDQVTILVITAHGATETPGYPAVELSDASQLLRAGDLTPAVGGAGRPAALRDAYDVAIVPDGVARVRWTFANRSGRPGQSITASVNHNVAITHLTSSTALLLHATWYAADGSVIPTSDAALAAARAARTNAERQQALRQAEQQHTTAPASLLDAFAVFSFNSPTGTKTSSGYIISHPLLSALPLSVLHASAGPGQLDLRQARHVTAPSGLDMWAIPGTNGLCVWATARNTGPMRRS
ncbi:MAG: hypothetical protein JO046_01795 [Solirubrobacterales bacterium]|nr:hypothetical protein [Solirubrobacterales bacterium]